MISYMKNILTVVFLVFLELLLPSILMALGFYTFTGRFWGPMLFSIGLVYVIGLIINKHYQHKVNTINERLQLSALQQSLEISCSYCRTSQIVPIKINKRNTFECNGCKKENLVVFQFTSAQLTEPMVVSEVSVAEPVENTNV